MLVSISLSSYSILIMIIITAMICLLHASLISISVITSVDGFINTGGGGIGLTHHRCHFVHQDMKIRAYYPSKQQQHQHHYFLKTNTSRRSSSLLLTSGGRMCGNNPRISSSSSQLLMSSSSSYSSIEPSSSRRMMNNNKSTAVYTLILISILSFAGDNILHLPIFRSMYLYHRNPYWWQLVTSTFCHGDKAHLSGNLFLLLLFGKSVEDELGSTGLILSYIFCGVVANLVSLLMLPKYTVSLGASGAVFGLFSVSILSRLSSWRDIFDWRNIIEVGVLGQFVFSQFLNEVKTAASGGIVGINHVAHLSGAAAGIGMILILRMLLQILEKKKK
jgi:membrane associated rhomboid family serine protease